jgi:hypothetical protein
MQMPTASNLPGATIRSGNSSSISLLGEAVSSAVRIRYMTAGAAILTLFGAWWCLQALAQWSTHPSWSIPAGIATTVTLLGLCVLRLSATRKMPRFRDPVAAAKGKHAGMLFGIIFGLEGVLIALCSALLTNHGLSPWIPTATAGIVGLHFIPLARVFEVPLYYWTGSLAVLGALGCLLVHDAGTRQQWVGFCMSAVLWGTAGLLLLQMHRSQPVQV